MNHLVIFPSPFFFNWLCNKAYLDRKFTSLIHIISQCNFFLQQAGICGCSSKVCNPYGKEATGCQIFPLMSLPIGHFVFLYQPTPPSQTFPLHQNSLSKQPRTCCSCQIKFPDNNWMPWIYYVIAVVNKLDVHPVAWRMKESWRQQTSRRNAADILSLGKIHKTKSLHWDRAWGRWRAQSTS